MTQNLAYQNLLDHWIGLDHFFNTPSFQKPTFPPYDIVREGDDYSIIMALAGYTVEDVSVTHVENTLVIESMKKTITKSEDTIKQEFLHKGIAKRSFKLVFNLSPEVKIDGSTLVNGILTINMHREVPEAKLPKQIPVIAG